MCDLFRHTDEGCAIQGSLYTTSLGNSVVNICNAMYFVTDASAQFPKDYQGEGFVSLSCERSQIKTNDAAIASWSKNRLKHDKVFME